MYAPVQKFPYKTYGPRMYEPWSFAKKLLFILARLSELIYWTCTIYIKWLVSRSIQNTSHPWRNFSHNKSKSQHVQKSTNFDLVLAMDCLPHCRSKNFKKIWNMQNVGVVGFWYQWLGIVRAIELHTEQMSRGTYMRMWLCHHFIHKNCPVWKKKWRPLLRHGSACLQPLRTVQGCWILLC